MLVLAVLQKALANMRTECGSSLDPVSQLVEFLLVVCVLSVVLGKVRVVSTEVKVMGMLQISVVHPGLIVEIAVVSVWLIDGVDGVPVVVLPLVVCFACLAKIVAYMLVVVLVILRPSRLGTFAQVVVLGLVAFVVQIRSLGLVVVQQ